MKVSLEGWRRNCGSWNISRAEIDSLRFGDAPTSYSPLETYFFGNKSGDVVIRHKSPELRLNGDYMVSIKFSCDDVAAMARAAFKGRPFEEIVELLQPRAET